MSMYGTQHGTSGCSRSASNDQQPEISMSVCAVEVVKLKQQKKSAKMQQTKKKVIKKTQHHWSSEEIGQFIDAYRKYANNWRIIQATCLPHITVQGVRNMYYYLRRTASESIQETVPEQDNIDFKPVKFTK